jgi:Glycosyltransferase family 87
MQLPRPRLRFDTRSPAAAAVLVFLLAVPVLALVKARTSPHYSLSKEAAVKVARSDRQVSRILAQSGPSSVRVSPLDDKQQRVTFMEGQRFLVDAAVSPGRRVTHIAFRTPGAPQSGSRIANAPAMLLLLTLLFVAALTTLPLVSLRNLDVLALASFTGSIWLINEGFVIFSLYACYPALIYLAGRCLKFGLQGPDPSPRTSLLWHLTRNWPSAQRQRVLGMITAAAALIVVLVVPSSTGPGDVGFAAVSGATDLLHGIVPYGHIPGFVVHGDTYPLLTYAAYMPVAAVMPVHDFFSDPEGALLVAAAATLLAGVGLYRITRRLAAAEAQGANPIPESPTFAATRIALAWLAFPAVLVTASAGSNDPLLAACVVAVFAYFEPAAVSTFLIGVAAWVKLIPVLALPFWLARLSRRAGARAVAALLALSVALLGWLLALGGSEAISAMASGLRFQLDRSSLHSPWVGLGLGALQPIAEAVLLAAIATAMVAANRDPALRSDLRRMAALFGAVMLLAQIAANYWTWAYLPWALVPILLSLLAPAPGGRDSAATEAEPIVVPDAAEAVRVTALPAARPAAR